MSAWIRVLITFIVGIVGASKGLAQMSEIYQLKLKSEEAMYRLTILADVVRSKSQSGDFSFIRNDSLKRELENVGLQVFSCYNDQQIPVYCVDKGNEAKLLEIMRAELLQSQALKNIYLRALRAVNSPDTRRELQSEIQKNRQAKESLEKLLQEHQTAMRIQFDEANRWSLAGISSNLKPLLGVITVIAAIYFIPVYILVKSTVAMSVVVAALFGGTGGIMLGEKYDQQRETYVQMKVKHLKQQIYEVEQRITSDMKYADIIDRAILETHSEAKITRP